MKKFYLAIAVLATSLMSSAQQLPNAGFEDWTDSYPWSSATNNSVTGQVDALGKTPTSWCYSNVYAKNHTLAQKAGKICEGPDANGVTGNCLKLNSLTVFGNVIPGYITLGTSWSTAKGVTGADNRDGGTWGGIDFTYRPDAISFKFRRTADAAGTLKSSIVIYSWKGTYSQKNVPAELCWSTNPATWDMENRDKVVLDFEQKDPELKYSLGDAPTKTDGAALISKTIHYYTDLADDWTDKMVEIDYLTNDTPDKFNIIFAASEYFSTSPDGTPVVYLDDLKLNYFSRLKSLKVLGTSVKGFSPDKYEYTIYGASRLVTADDVVCEVLGNSGMASAIVGVETPKQGATTQTIVITVTNSESAKSAEATDVDGETSHTYTITLSTEDEPIAGTRYDGNLVIEDFLPDPTKATVYIETTGEGKCIFKLPNFAIDFGYGPTVLGDIIVPDVTVTESEGVKTYEGAITGLALLDGAIIADAEVHGTEQADGTISMQIPVIWHIDETQTMPINVTFNGKKTTSGIDDVITDDDTDTDDAWYNLQGIRVDNPQNGIFIHKGKKIWVK